MLLRTYDILTHSFFFQTVYRQLQAVAYRWGGEGFNPPPKFRKPSKIVPNSTRLWKLLKIAEFRTPTPQDVRKKGSNILKLQSVRNCFTLAMTNKLVVIINSLKIPTIKKFLLYEMKFLVPNYSCLQKPWLGGYRPQIPVLSVLCPQPNCWTPREQNSWVRHWLQGKWGWTVSCKRYGSRSQWPRGLRRRSADARLLRLWFRIPPGAWMSVVSVECCQVEVSATGWSLVQRSPTDCGASLCVI